MLIIVVGSNPRIHRLELRNAIIDSFLAGGRREGPFSMGQTGGDRETERERERERKIEREIERERERERERVRER